MFCPDRSVPQEPEEPPASSSESSSQVVWYDEIPGSICGPEDGPWPRPFTNLDAPEAWNRLSDSSNPESLDYGTGGRRWRADALNFQPCRGAKSQDRYAMQQLDIRGRIWTLTAVFDGEYICASCALSSSSRATFSRCDSSQDTSGTQPSTMRHTTCPSSFASFWKRWI